MDDTNWVREDGPEETDNNLTDLGNVLADRDHDIVEFVGEFEEPEVVREFDDHVDSDGDAGPLPLHLLSIESTTDGVLAIAGGTDKTTGTEIEGLYGTLHIGSDGSYNYVLYTNTDEGPEGAYEAVQALADGEELTDSFDYVLSDGDLTDDGNLTITIFGDNDIPDQEFGLTVDDEGLSGIVGGPNDAPDANADGDNDESTTKFTVDFGDAGSGTIDFSAYHGLAVKDSSDNLVYTVDGQTMTWDWDAATQTLIAEADDDQDDVIKISPDGGNDYKVEILEPLKHNDPSPPDGTSDEDNIDFFFEFGISDGFGETATGQLGLSVDDDSPVVIDPDTAYLVNEVDAFDHDVPLDIDSDVVDNAGADGLGSLVFSGVSNGDDSGKTSGGQIIYLYLSPDGTTLIGSTTVNVDYTANDTEVTDNKVFTIALDPSAGTYDFDLHVQIDGGITTFNVGDLGYDFHGGNDPYAYFDDTTADNRDVLLTPREFGLPNGTANTNANEGGVSAGNSVGADESLLVDFVHNIEGDTDANVGGDDYGNALNRDHGYSGHYMVNGASASITQVVSGPTSIEISAMIDDDTGAGIPIGVVGDGTNLTPTNINQVRITYNGMTVIVFEGLYVNLSDFDVGGQTFSIDFLGDSVIVNGVETDTDIAVFAEDNYTTVEYKYVDGGTFKIGGFGAGQPDPGELLTLEYDLALTDGDGDGVIIDDAINISLSPENHVIEEGDDGNDMLTAVPGGGTLIGHGGDDDLIGDVGEDILIGGAGNDALAGNEGDDLLIGGAGNDTYVYNDPLDGHDVISGFEPGSDVIDLDGLFDTLGVDPADRGADLNFAQVDANTVEVTVDGVADFSITVESAVPIDQVSVLAAIDTSDV